MGYSTVYTLEYKPAGRGILSKDHEKELLAAATVCVMHDEDYWPLEETLKHKSGYRCKWYEHQKHMKHFSKQFPTTLFTLSGEGEEPGDLWKKYFLNGKIQVANAKITYDKFDARKLK